MPLDKREYLKDYFSYFSSRTYAVGTQTNCFLSTQNKTKTNDVGTEKKCLKLLTRNYNVNGLISAASKFGDF